MCTTTSHYETHISTECSTGGSGQCDGECYVHFVSCTCSCHSDWEGDLPTTVSGMQEWHDEANDVVARFVGETSSEQALIVAKALNTMSAPWKGVAGMRYSAIANLDGAYVLAQSK